MSSSGLHAGGSMPAITRKLLAWSCVLLAGATLSSSAFAKKHVRLPIAEAHAAPLNRPDPEILLLEVYRELGANHLREAQSKADALVAAYPTFRLGQLIRGDLLQLHTKPISTFGAAPNAPKDKLENLREEAVVRLKSLMQKPDPSLVPHAVLQLRDDQKYVLLVDAKRSRLYVYTNQHGQLKYLSDYYVSQGKLGVHKIREGDQRTPIGVYYVTQRVPGAKLPDFYGAGALPINFPNEWDKINGRSGSGIWLHGTPSDTYSRPPLSSDGCVVLTNPDLHKLYESVEVGKTPVVIGEQIEFVSKAKWESDRNFANKLVDGWRRDIEARDASRVVANYSRQFKSEHGETLSSLYEKYQHIFSGVKDISVSLHDVTFFLYPGRDDLIVSTFTQESVIGKTKSVLRKRQYWEKEGSQWKIVSETYF
jgi:murein L,D-transpeptidase YafK